MHYESKKQNRPISQKLDFSQLRVCRPHPPPLRIAHIFMKDVHSAKLNEESIFRFLSNGWLYLQFTGDTAEWVSAEWVSFVSTETNEKLFLCFFIFWVMVDFVLKMNRKIYQLWAQNQPYLKN